MLEEQHTSTASNSDHINIGTNINITHQHGVLDSPEYTMPTDDAWDDTKPHHTDPCGCIQHVSEECWEEETDDDVAEEEIFFLVVDDWTSRAHHMHITCTSFTTHHISSHHAQRSTSQRMTYPDRDLDLSIGSCASCRTAVVCT